MSMSKEISSGKSSAEDMKGMNEGSHEDNKTRKKTKPSCFCEKHSTGSKRGKAPRSKGKPCTSNKQKDIANSSMNSDAVANLASKSVARATKKEKKGKKPVEESEATSEERLQKRMFFHSRTLVPMTKEEVMSGQDSEDESDHEDSQRIQMLNVSNYQKRVMCLWNSFAKKNRIFANSQMPYGCEAFSRFHEKELNGCSSLLSSWRIFMIKLWKDGLLDAATMNRCNLIIKSCRNIADTNNNNNNNNVDHPNADTKNNNDNNNVDHPNVDTTTNNNNVDRPIADNNNNDNNNVDHPSDDDNNNNIDYMDIEVDDSNNRDK